MQVLLEIYVRSVSEETEKERIDRGGEVEADNHHFFISLCFCLIIIISAKSCSRARTRHVWWSCICVNVHAYMILMPEPVHEQGYAWPRFRFLPGSKFTIQNCFVGRFQCSATCGGGRKLRKIYCMQGEEKVNETLCDSKLRPAIRKECHLKECPEWYPGGWGPVSIHTHKAFREHSLQHRLSSCCLLHSLASVPPPPPRVTRIVSVSHCDDARKASI